MNYPQRVARDFTFTGIRYNILTLPSRNRLQVWFQMDPDPTWRIGHGKDIPEGMSPVQAADLAADFITGRITHEEYNEQLPGT